MDKRLKQSRRELEQWCRDHEKRREVTRRLLLAQANEHAALPDMSVNMFETRPAGQWICDLAEDRSAALFGDLWLEGELSILFADTGVGKSILAVQIAEAIAAGKDAFALGESSTDLPLPNGTSPQPVLYLDFELSGRQFTDRYTGDGGAYKFSPDIIRAEIVWHDEPPLGYADASQFMASSIIAKVEETGARVLIVDNISYLNDSTMGAAPALRLMKSLKALKTEYALSILVLAHTPKRSYTKLITVNDLQGSKNLANFADNIFAIGSDQNRAGIRYIKHIKPRSRALTYDASNVITCRLQKPSNFPHFQFLGYGPEAAHIRRLWDHTAGHRDHLIAETHRLHSQGQTVREIAHELNLSTTTTHRYLQTPLPKTETP